MSSTVPPRSRPPSPPSVGAGGPDDVGLLGRWTPFQRDVAGMLLLLASVLAIVALGGDDVFFSVGAPRPTWLGLALLAATVVPLAWRRVRPELAMAASGIATGAFYFVGFVSPVGPVGVLFALYAISAYSPERRDGVGSLVVSMLFVTASFWAITDALRSDVLAEYALTTLLFVTAWGLGEATRVRRRLELELRGQARRAEQARRLEHDRATAQERNRIARELHDVVAHTVAVLVVQAGAGRHVAARQPERAAEVLRQIETTGREALDELRRILGVLRAADDDMNQRSPQPRLDGLDGLVAPLREAGMPVRLDVQDRRRADAPPVPVGVEVSAYRIVQEALTNVLKHAGRVDDVTVTVELGDEDLVLAVRDDGRGTPPRDPGETAGGQGLVGMRERVDMLGGRIDAGPRRGGGYRVRAEIPLATPTGSRA